MTEHFDRMIAISIKDGNDELLQGAVVEWFADDNFVGKNIESDGHASLTIKNPDAVIKIRVSYPNEPSQEVTLAANATSWDFKFPGVVQHSKLKDFLMKHFPALVGIVFILIALVLVFAFGAPTSIQKQVILALFALGGGGFGGEIAGFINANIKLGQQLVISAGGAAAIFALLYFFTPAGAQ